jgi:hypothetical protein
MEKLLALMFCICLFDSCKKCESVNFGKVNLMPSSTALSNSLNKKTLIFKDSTGVEIQFSNRRGIEKRFETLSLKQICPGSLGFGGVFSSIELETNRLFFASSISSTLELNSMVINTNQTSEVQDTILYDVLKVTMNGLGFTSISSRAEQSKRGTNKANLTTNDIFHENITLLGKPLKQVTQSKSILKAQNVEPSEVFYNTTQGVVAMRLLNEKLFVLDRIE